MKGLEHFKLESQEYTPIDGVDIDTEETEKVKDEKIPTEDEKETKVKDEKETKVDTEKEKEKESEKESTDEEKLEEERKETIAAINAKKEDERTDEEKKFLEDFGEAQEKPFVDVIKELEKSDYIILGDDQEVDSFDDSVESIGQVISTTVDNKIKEVKESYPEPVKNLLDFLDNGGKFDDYADVLFEEKYAEIDISDVTNQKIMVNDYLLAQGHDQESATEQIEIFEEKGLLEKQAKLGQKALAANQKAKEAERVNAQKLAKQNAVNKYKSDIKEFGDKVANIDKVAGIQITKTEAKQLSDYMTKPVKNGKTQWALDSTFDNKVKQAYFSMKKFDMTKLEKKAATKSNADLRKQLNKLGSGLKDKKSSTAVNTKTEKDKEETPQKLVIPKLTWMS